MSNNELTKEEILKDLILNEEDTLKNLKELVEKSKEFIRIEGKSGKIIFQKSQKIFSKKFSKYSQKNSKKISKKISQKNSQKILKKFSKKFSKNSQKIFQIPKKTSSKYHSPS